MRSKRGCALVQISPVKPFRPVKWDLDGRQLHEVSRGSPYMGRPKDRSLVGKVELGRPFFPDHPWEDSCEGCPGSWYRTPFWDSVYPYIRQRAEGGMRIPNPLFEDADRILQEAVQYYEYEEERLLAYRNTVWEERRAAKEKKDNRKQTVPRPPSRRR